MNKTVIYIHGLGGSACEAEHYAPLFPSLKVTGFDYRAETPWQARDEFPAFARKTSADGSPLILIANSIGAYFAMQSLCGSGLVEKAVFISPVIDMEGLILGMMRREGISENELRQKEKIITSSGETLSWEYLQFARLNPARWDTPALVIYGENDNITGPQTVTDFARAAGAELAVMKGAEHWFHTAEQMDFIDREILKFFKNQE